MGILKRAQVGLVTGIIGLAALPPAAACTNIVVTKKASKTGFPIVSYTVDGEFHPALRYLPAQDHKPGEMLDITDYNDKVVFKIPQIPHTYAVIGIMNEHQLVIGETTFDGREELENKKGGLDYWTMMGLALQRAKTAREAIRVLAGLADEFGYNSTGETFSIADKEEVWLMEMIGPGEGGKGAYWVAVKIPDGTISAHANKARIGTFPLNDPENALYSPDVIRFAEAKGYFNPKLGKPFDFCEAYCPATPQKLRYTETRVWSIFRRAAPSQTFSSNYHRGVVGAERYPLWIQPERKLGTQDVIALMRDHYEGTPFDMTVGVDAGPFGSPNRPRPMHFRQNGADYSWERPISTPQTANSYVAEVRGDLPATVGGVLWYGVDDSYTNCYFPLYTSITTTPVSYGRWDIRQFTWDSAWWTFNFVANYANLRYSFMVKDIQKVQSELEGQFFAAQPAVEKIAVELAKTDVPAARRLLTDYSVGAGENVTQCWRGLARHLMARYNDGYVQDAKGQSKEIGYPDTWLKTVLQARPAQFKLPEGKVARPDSY